MEPVVLVRLNQAANSKLPMIIAGLVMKGFVYCALPVAFPIERIAHIAQTVGMAAIVCHSSHASSLESIGVRIISVDTMVMVQSVPAVSAYLWRAVHAGDIEYMVHTSGTTGKPKTVAISQGSSAAMLQGMCSEHCVLLGKEDVLLQTAATTFDPHVFQVFAPLALGGLIVMLRPDNPLTDPEYLLCIIKKHRVTCVDLVPSLASLIVDLLICAPNMRDSTSSIRSILMAGEAFQRALITSLESIFTVATIYSTYGPAECTDRVSSHHLRSDQLGVEISPLGFPLPGRICRVTTPFGSVCPDGLHGELYIGGIGVMVGYMGSPDLTQKALVTISNEVFYRSGDRVCVRDGDRAIEYHGRVDFQIKIRGQRLEPAEIEKTVESVEGVERAVVMKEGHTDRLVVFVKGSAGAVNIVEASLREVCVRTLPSYMVPSVFVIVDSFALNANGKIDRKALLAQAMSLSSESLEDVVDIDSLSPIALQVNAIWTDAVQSACPVSMSTSFFDLGGNSLSLARVHMRLAREVAGYNLKLSDLYSVTSISHLLSKLDTASEGSSEMTELKGEFRSQSVLSLSQERILFHDIALRGQKGYGLYTQSYS